jgi:hypothetical protein
MARPGPRIALGLAFAEADVLFPCLDHLPRHLEGCLEQ